MKPFIHETAIIEDNVEIGDGTYIWSHVHIRPNARIGEECIIGEKTYIAYDVTIGSRCKINAFVYICHKVTIEDGVMCGAGVTFTNDRFPRAASWDLDRLLPSGPPHDMPESVVRRGATLGAGVCVAPGVTIGEWATIGMSSTVVRDVGPHLLVAGNPARRIGYVCRCGWRVAAFLNGPERDLGEVGVPCGQCGSKLRSPNGQIEYVHASKVTD
ncbi:MAG: DapH/DapD/GlmU-related protein [Planctomycetota bacterium]